jgi:DNA helicase-2/ATP-dependent DNA helicase PcrA
MFVNQKNQPWTLKMRWVLGLGQKVVHPTFGLGVVLNYEGSGESARVQINFEKAGSKWLVLAFAKLEMLG